MEAIAHYFNGTPTELLIIDGRNITKDGQPGNISVEMMIPTTMAVQIMEAGRYYQYCQHVGHAIWHVKNPDAKWGDDCSSCVHARDEAQREKIKRASEEVEERDSLLRQALTILVSIPEDATCEDERKDLVSRIQEVL